MSKYENYIFDLDNTLYPYDNGIFSRQMKRMTKFIQIKLNIDSVKKAEEIRNSMFVDHGLTFLGLMKQYGMEYDEFVSFVDDFDISDIQPNLELNIHLQELKNQNKKLYIFTNASAYHTERLMIKFGFKDLFDGVLTLEDGNLIPKPQQRAYEFFFEKFDIQPEKSIFFEDSIVNLIAGKDFGMDTVLVHAEDDAHNKFKNNTEIDFYVKNAEDFFKNEHIDSRL